MSTDRLTDLTARVVTQIEDAAHAQCGTTEQWMRGYMQLTADNRARILRALGITVRVKKVDPTDV